MKSLTLTYYQDNNVQSDFSGTIEGSNISFYVSNRSKEERTQIPETLGVYVLLGKNPITQVYIGETTNLKRRISEHNQLKDFWDRCIVFYKNDNIDNFTSTEIMVLEALLISKVQHYGYVNVLYNSQVPSLDNMPDTIIRRVLCDYFSHVEFILNALNIPMLKQLYSDTDKINSILDSNKKPIHSIGNRANKLDKDYTKNVVITDRISGNDQLTTAFLQDWDNMYSDETLQYTLKTDDVYVNGAFTNYTKNLFCIFKGSVINVTENNKDFFKDLDYNKCILKNHIVIDLYKNIDFGQPCLVDRLFRFLTMVVTGINETTELCKQLRFKWTFKILAEDNGEQ